MIHFVVIQKLYHEIESRVKNGTRMTQIRQIIIDKMKKNQFVKLCSFKMFFDCNSFCREDFLCIFT